jgi:hypothetical protein
MGTALEPRPAERPVEHPPGPQWDRLVIGILLFAGGAGWLLDSAGVPVPWYLAPAAALILIGLAGLASLAGGSGRGGLVGLGVLAAVLAVAAGMGVERYAGPVGERTIVPARDGWPQPIRMAAGSVVVDLTQEPLPAGRLDVAVGAGEVTLRLPDDAAVRADLRVVAGAVVVDGTQLRQGVDVHWSQPARSPDAAELRVDVGAGQVEVDHVPA